MNQKLLIINLIIGIAAASSIMSHQNSDSKHLNRLQHRRQNGSSGQSLTDPLVVASLGIFLFFAMIPFLWLNERRYLINTFHLGEAEKICRNVNCTVFDTDCDKQLVYMIGSVKTDNELVDQQFSVSEVGSMKLERIVEMYQWIQLGCRGYKYDLQWSQTFHDSSKYEDQDDHYNAQDNWVVQKQTYAAKDVFLGKFLLSESLIYQTQASVVIQLNEDNTKLIPENFRGKHKHITCQNNSILFQQDQSTISARDLRVTFMKVPCNTVSVVAQQTSNTFESYQIHDKYGDPPELHNVCCGVLENIETAIGEIEWMYETSITKKQAFYNKIAQNFKTTVISRFGGWLAMGLGLSAFFLPISLLISLVQVVGNILAQLSSFILILLSFTIATPVALITVATAWLYYRPVIALLLLSIAGVLGGAIFFFISKHNE